MKISRRLFVSGAIAAPFVIRSTGQARADARILKISHQFPGATGSDGDFRDQLVNKFAAEVEKRSDGALKFNVYPGSSLMKTNAQFSALRKGALDLSLFPIAYAGGEIPECNIAQLPGIVTTYEHGLSWRTKPAGEVLESALAAKGVMILTWVWQAAGCVSKAQPVVAPEDAKGVKVRGGSREMDLVFQRIGSTVVSFPSNELYVAMQTGICEAAVTSSTSMISFRTEEVARHLATGRGNSYQFTFQPLLISKIIFDSLSDKEKQIVTSVGLELQEFGLKGALADDERVEQTYKKAGADVHMLTPDIISKWVAISKETAWKDFAGKSENCAKLLALAASA
ncbi:TRAP transporter substrate-binding protein DctP [Roseixanthobacter pseudopolyaromaticivorans]|uniref:TRAP transporter substrate-binding protein DctP n=1 Tax=Xanthobacteraceae TaxID=335928 RepID=UPI00372AC8F1